MKSVCWQQWWCLTTRQEETHHQDRYEAVERQGLYFCLHSSPAVPVEKKMVSLTWRAVEVPLITVCVMWKFGCIACLVVIVFLVHRTVGLSWSTLCALWKGAPFSNSVFKFLGFVCSFNLLLNVPFHMLVYFSDRSAQAILRAATLRQKLHIKAFHLTQSQYTDTGPTSPRADPVTPGTWQGSHWNANV